MHAKRIRQVYEALLLVGGEVMGMHTASFEDPPPLSRSPITELRLAAAKMTGANRRAFEAEMTLDEFAPLVPPVEAAFQAHRAAWRLDGQPQTASRLSVYVNCPLPTPEDRRFFVLTYLKTYSLQVGQGRLFGRGQSKAHPWMHVLRMHVLLPGLLAPRAQRLGGSEADAATVVVPREEAPAPYASS